MAERTESRFEKRRRRNRGALLEAAVALFQEQGIRATKLEEICERADVSTRTFFNHFESREQLYREIGQQRAEQLAELIRATDPTSDQSLRALLQEMGAYLAARPAYRELVGEMLALQASHGDARARGGVIGRAMNDFFEAGVSAGVVTSRHSPATLADLAIGAITTALANWCADTGFELEPELEASALALQDIVCRSPS